LNTPSPSPSSFGPKLSKTFFIYFFAFYPTTAAIKRIFIQEREVGCCSAAVNWHCSIDEKTLQSNIIN